MLEDDETGNLLTEPLCIGDLIKYGAKFEINAALGDNLSSDLFDDAAFGGSDDEDDESKHEVTVTPWEKSFDELRQQMIKINDHIYKRVTHQGDAKFGSIPDRARVVIEYDAYWEKDMHPFDSSHLRGERKIFHCGKNEVLTGLESAVRTMLKGEESQFVISYHLLFHEMGCPPRIKPKADGLFIIKLIDFVDYGDANAIDNVPEADRNKFSVIIDKVKDIHIRGLDLYKVGSYSAACKTFHKAVNALEFCRVIDENEQNEQQKFLVKLYINLAVCYNRLNLPAKACIMCNQIRKITNINNNCKALFQEGRALLMLGEFIRARQKLVRAQMLQPNNQEIVEELKLLAKKYEEYRENERNLWQKAMRIKNDVNDNCDDNDKGKENEGTFKEETRKLLKRLMDTNNGQNSISLPDGLSPQEINIFQELCEEFDLKFNLKNVCNQKRYTISKK